MPSHKPLRTYERKVRNGLTKVSQSVDAVNALFVKNLKKRLSVRRSGRYKTKELPPRVQAYISDSSKGASIDDTFDKLKKNNVYNEVNIVSKYLKVSSSSDDVSGRTRSKVHVSVSLDPLPPVRRKRKRKAKKPPSPRVEKSNCTLDRPVTSSLSVEVDPKKFSYASLSYIKVPLLSDTFREQPHIHSSTPFRMDGPAKIIEDPISPISKSSSSTSSNLTQKSYNVIKKWSSKCPLIEEHPWCSRPKDKPTFDDWKLMVSPKVFLRAEDAIVDRFKGFRDGEQATAQRLASTWCSELERLKKELENTGAQNRFKRLRNGRLIWAKPRVPSRRKSTRITKVSLENLEEEVEVAARIYSPPPCNLTADVEDFESFLQHHMSDLVKGEAGSSSTPKLVKFERKSLDFLISPKPNVTKNLPNSSSKIIIHSDITLGAESSLFFASHPLVHDHTYSRASERLMDVVEISDSSMELSRSVLMELPKVKVEAGKKYRRSISLWRKSVAEFHLGECKRDCKCIKCRVKRMKKETRRTSRIVPLPNCQESILKSYANRSYVREEKDNTEEIDAQLDASLRGISITSLDDILSPTAREIVLRRCEQAEALPFEECYPKGILQNCHKIGEGVYGEVFLFQNPNGGTTVMKVIPIEGEQIVNGERQKKFEEILSEIVISMELSNLRQGRKSQTSAFTHVQAVRCTQGKYPDRLLDLWDLYDETKQSENDSPQIFTGDQQYIVLELGNGGIDLESYCFNNAQQVYSLVKQTAFALAVAEQELKFEHRDLHWGNILINRVDKTDVLTFRLNDRDIKIPSHGIEVTIIDFTLSRIEYDSVVIFNDLALDPELFMAEGDYQFDIYRLMQKHNENKWQHFQPYSNVLWLHYILDKVPVLHYKNKKSRLHLTHIDILENLKAKILDYKSVNHFVDECFPLC